jgi:hypothetical protein
LIELKYDAKDIEIIDMTMYKWNRKNEIKEKKNTRNQPSKMEKKNSGNNHNN